MKKPMRIMLAAGLAAASIAASAESSITVDNVVQRWPWNNKLDITYTVSGGQDVAAGVYARIVFTASIGTTNIVIDGVNDVGANASDGTHTVTWTLPDGLRANGCTMTAQLLSADVPSGDDYMIVDLDTGAVTWEGLYNTQAESNDRYNAATYKTVKLALRKIPAGGSYPTGDDAHYAPGVATSDLLLNSSTNWVTTRDYYVGVFPVTQRQYEKITGETPSTYTSTSISGNTKNHRPVECVSWNDLRLSTTAPTSSIPAVVSDNTGTFFQRLNYKTGFYFDLPTEVMAEIAERAGATTTYFWGDTMVTNYVTCKEDPLTNNGKSTVAVGSRLPNAWGLYDTAGNVWEWCLDDMESTNLANAADPFTPFCSSGTKRRLRGGGSVANDSSNANYRASRRDGDPPDTQKGYAGFRVSMIVD